MIKATQELGGLELNLNLTCGLAETEPRERRQAGGDGWPEVCWMAAGGLLIVEWRQTKADASGWLMVRE